MIDHIGLAVSDLARSRAFYEAAVKPLGLEVLKVAPNAIGGTAVMFGPPGDEPQLVIADGGERPGEGNHLAFRAESRDQVHAFHAAALAAGRADNGAPGLRPGYAPKHYAAFVLDPDGFNIEAVCYE